MKHCCNIGRKNRKEQELFKGDAFSNKSVSLNNAVRLSTQNRYLYWHLKKNAAYEIDFIRKQLISLRIYVAIGSLNA